MENEHRKINRKKLFLLIFSTVLVILLAIVGLSAFLTGTSSSRGNNNAMTPTPGQKTLISPTTTPGKAPTPLLRVTMGTSHMTPAANTGAPTVTGASSLLFGTNLSLQSSSDQVLTSATTRTLLQQMHVGAIRIPTHGGSDTTYVQAAQVVKGLGAVPVVILQGDKINKNALADDTKIVTAMNGIFGSSIVYYEYGNEEDFFGPITAQDYTTSWNNVIPALKKLATNGHFVGPVNYQYSPAYLQYFLQHAQPLPNEVSWHEYACAANWANDLCMSHLDNWSVHIAGARSIMNATIGTSLPVMITEWNYTANPIANDGKSNNAAFMTAWTTKALQTLAASGVFAAMQFSCTNYSIPLIDSSNNLTAQGMTFQTQYKSMVGG